MKKSPLQQWSWNRYQLKRTVTWAINRLSQMLELKDTTEAERRRLDCAKHELKLLIKTWNAAHKMTRGRREDESKNL